MRSFLASRWKFSFSQDKGRPKEKRKLGRMLASVVPPEKSGAGTELLSSGSGDGGASRSKSSSSR